VDDTARAIREAGRVSHQLGAIKLHCGDSDHCVLPKGSAPDICAVASERKIQDEKEANQKCELEADGRTTRMRRMSRNCKIANFRVREVRVVSLSDLIRKRYVKLLCVWFFTVERVECVTFRDDSL